MQRAEKSYSINIVVIAGHINIPNVTFPDHSVKMTDKDYL